MWVLLTAWIPILSTYIQKRIWMGHSQVLLLVLTTGLSQYAVKLWSMPHAPEWHWLFAIGAAILMAFCFLILCLESFVNALRLLRMINDYPNTMTKIVTVVVLILLSIAAYLVRIHPNQAVKEFTSHTIVQLEKRNFKTASALLKSSLPPEHASNPAKHRK
jgi:hypothetical protein